MTGAQQLNETLLYVIIGVDLSPRLGDIEGGLGNGSPPRRPGVEPR